jgi:outer membrane protein assembly factor BamD (BamD/ComL family)
MRQGHIWISITFIGLLIPGCAALSGKSKNADLQRRPLSAVRTEQLLGDIEKLQKAADAKQVKAAKRTAKQLLADFPEIAKFDLKHFTKAEIATAKGKRAHAVRHYQKLIDEYPESELYNSALNRLFHIGKSYLAGTYIFEFFFIKVKGDARGVKIMEDIMEEVGFEDANGLGVQGAILAANNLEQRKHYEGAYLKWMELATVWDEGEIGQQTLLGMARNKRASYNRRSTHRRHLYDTSKLKAAKSYYQKFQIQYPEQAQALNIQQILLEIDEQMAFKEYSIGHFYERTGKKQAANIYFTMVVETWPHTKAAQKARERMQTTNLNEP